MHPSIKDFNNALIIASLEHCEGNITKTAKFLGVNRGTLQARLFEIDKLPKDKLKIVASQGTQNVVSYLEHWWDSLVVELSPSDRAHALELVCSFMGEKASQMSFDSSVVHKALPR